MKRNYLGVVERIKEIALAHPQVNSVDEGRVLEFDTKKASLFPRVFIRTDSSPILGGQGTVLISVNFSLLVMDRLNAKRSNVMDVMNTNHTIAMGILATLNKEQLTRTYDNPTLLPLYDYQDTQTAGWIAPISVYLDTVYECYPVP